MSGIRMRRFVIASLTVVATMLAVSAWAWTQLPPGGSVPVHWDLEGNPNGFAPKEVALLISPGLGLLLTGVFWAIPVIEPRRANLLGSSRAYGVLWVGTLATLLLVHLVTTLAILGGGIDVSQIILVAVGVLFAAIGLVLPGIRSNFLFGIRTPWTLTSERSWERTHRAGGWLFVAFGLALAATGLLRLGELAFVVAFVGGGVAICGLVAYSYVVWRADPERQTFGR